MVLHEIVRAPKEVSNKKKKKLYKVWRQGYSHPLLPSVCQAAEVMLEGKELPVESVLDLMSQFTGQRGQYNALNIVYFSCDDTEGKVEELYTKITEQWRGAK